MAKYDAYGTRFQMDNGAGVYATIGQVKNIGGPSLALDTEDVTTHDSTGAWEEVVPTILRTGEGKLDLVFDPALATHDAVTAATGLAYVLKNKALRAFKIIFPDAANTEWSFNGYVTGYEPSAPVDGALTASVTVKFTGSPTLA